MIENKIWVEKYRPKNVEELALPPRLINQFKGHAKEGFLPNLILGGPAGIGKTSIAKAMIQFLGGEVLEINGSLDGNIDTLRGVISQFASTMSLEGNRKYVLIDEGDYLNAQSTQPALRNFIESHSRDTSFIITANYPNRIIPEIHSRMPTIDFTIRRDERVPTMKLMLARLVSILSAEGVKFDQKAIANLIGSKFPDFRSVIGTCQAYAVQNNNVIDSGVLHMLNNEQIEALVTALKSKDFKAIRTWVGENSDVGYQNVYRMFYDSAYSLFNATHVPHAVGLLAKGLDWHARSVDHEITMTATLFEIAQNVQWAS